MNRYLSRCSSTLKVTSAVPLPQDKKLVAHFRKLDEAEAIKAAKAGPTLKASLRSF
jgi:hypothetical protein